MKPVRAFAVFWWDFVVGDDWHLAVAVVAGLALCALLAQARVAAWWATPALVLAGLWVSAHRVAAEARARRRGGGAGG
ncbi:MAG: hypothetical protein ABSA40_09220 [Candidatus Dormibacteria bacterium]